MLKIFIQVMEAGVAFALTVAILMAYYRTENPNKKKIVMAVSLALGVIAAIISAVIRSIPNFVNRTSLSFWSMVPLVISLIGILIIMAFEKKLRKDKSNIYESLFTAFLGIYTISTFFYYMPALFTEVKNFVYYGESAVSTMVLFRIMGYTLALLIIFLSSIAIYNTAIKLSSRQLKTILVLTLLIRGISQINVIVQRFYSLGIIPRNKYIFSIIAAVVNHENILVFVIMLILGIAPLILWKENTKVTEPYNNNAELRKIKFIMRNKRHWAQFFLVLIIINFVSLTALKAYAGREVALSEPEEYKVADGMIEIPLETLEDNHLHRYLYKAQDGTQMRFFAIKKSENSYGVVLDACEICGPSGYYERKDQVVCKLCDVVMNRGTIGFAGGCNPIPFPYIVHDKKIKIAPKDLDALSYVFK